jgi:hypothetical protein
MCVLSDLQESLAKDLVQFETVLDQQQLEEVEKTYQTIHDLLHDIKKNLNQ